MNTFRKTQKSSPQKPRGKLPPRSAGIKSVEIVGRILRALAMQAKAVGLKDLARASGMPAPKVHRYLASLVRIGLVQQSGDDRSYALGPFALEVGAAAARSSAPLQIAIDRFHRLRDLIDETIVLSVWSPHGPIILEVEESTRPIVTTMKRGSVLPVLSTATGVVFCAQLPRFHTAALIKSELSGELENNPIVKNMKELEDLLSSVREQGYALNAGHLLPDVMALAAPAFDLTGSLTAVLAVIGREDRIDPRFDDRALRALLSVTRRNHKS